MQGRTKGFAIFLGIALFLGIWRSLFPERGLEAFGLRALADAFFALGLLFIVLAIAGGIGGKLLPKFDLMELNTLEEFLFSLALGLGVLAYGVFAFALLGWLSRFSILGWLVVIALICRKEIGELVTRLPELIRDAKVSIKQFGWPGKGLVAGIGLIFLMCLIQALAPPWSYDALMYHLQAPRIFLEAGSIQLLPDLWQANGPMTIEMLFTIGLAFGSDTFARLIHLAFMAILFLTTYALGKRALGGSGAQISLAVLAGIPILPLWGNLAYIDMGIAAYSLFAIFCLYLWSRNGQKKMFYLAGALMGFALGTKYLALGLSAALGLWVFWESRREGTFRAMRKVAGFGIIAALVASPWYLKNLILTGNPVYPFFFGGPQWEAERLNSVMAYLYSFGGGRTLVDWMSLPVTIYTKYPKFGTLLGSVDVPSFLFPLVLLYPWARKKVNLDGLVTIVGFYFVAWTLGTQQTRFLLPIYPALSVLVAQAVLWVGELAWLRRYGRSILIGLLGGVLAATFLYQAIQFISMAPHKVVLGLESKSEFLTRAVTDYRATTFIQRELPETARVLMVWDGRGYYCDQRCVPDPDQVLVLPLEGPMPEPHFLAADLKSKGITHLLLDLRTFHFFSEHDPGGRHRRAADYLLDVFVPACGNEMFRDAATLLLEVSCES